MNVFHLFRAPCRSPYSDTVYLKADIVLLLTDEDNPKLLRVDCIISFKISLHKERDSARKP